MNTADYITKYSDFYLPPEAERVYETVKHVDQTIYRLSKCLKLPNLDAKLKRNIKSFYLPNKLEAIDQFEDLLKKLRNLIPFSYEHENPAVTAIILEGTGVIYDALVGCRNAIEKRKLRDNSLVKKIDTFLLHIEQFKKLPENKKQSLFYKGLSFIRSSIKTTIVGSYLFAKHTVQSVRRHSTAFVASAAFFACRKSCEYLASKDVINGQYCPAAETSWDTTAHLTIAGISLTVIIVANRFFVKTLQPISCARIIHTGQMIPLQEERLALAKKHVKRVLKKINRTEMLIQFKQSLIPGEGAKTTVYKQGIHIQGKAYTLRIIMLENLFPNTWANYKSTCDFNDENSVLHELKHALDFDHPYGIIEDQIIKPSVLTFEVFVLRSCLPFPLSLLFFKILFKPTFDKARDPNYHETLIELDRLFLQTINFRRIPASESFFSFSFAKFFTSQVSVELTLKRFQEKECEMLCDQFAATHITTKRCLISSKTYYLIKEDYNTIPRSAALEKIEKIEMLKNTLFTLLIKVVSDQIIVDKSFLTYLIDVGAFSYFTYADFKGFLKDTHPKDYRRAKIYLDEYFRRQNRARVSI